MGSLPPPPPIVPPIGADLANTALGRLTRESIIRYFHATIDGLDHIPQATGALLVGNHALFGLDGFVLASLILRGTRRYPRFLGERNLWKVPVLGPVLTALGACEGEPKAAQRLLEDGELVVVYPGGVDDSFKTREARHKLQWGTRAGFAKVAMRAKVPLLPVAGLGIDEMYDVVGRERWLGRALLGSHRYDLPIAFGAYGTLLPKRSPQHYAILPPVDTSGDPDDDDAVENVRVQAYRAIEVRLRELREQQSAG